MAELPVLDEVKPRAERCGTCRFWERLVPDEDAENPGNGVCRRRAPVAVPISQDARVYEYATWPITFPFDWCGEWKANDAAPAPGADAEKRLSFWWRNESGLSARAVNCLSDLFYPRLEWSAAELAAKSDYELLAVKNLGHVTLGEIREWLAARANDAAPAEPGRGDGSR